MTALSDKAFVAVTRLFEGVSGIRLGQNKHALVAGRLQKLAQEAGEANVDAYVDRLVAGHAPAAEMTRVIDRLTTNETYFFREPQHFNDLGERLRADPQREWTVWSAASSSGEEAYSTAMLMADVLGQRPWQVIGTDLSTSVVASARRALYPLERARMVPPEYLKHYCLKGQGEHAGQLLIAKSLRERVRFLQANLMQDLPKLPLFDVIFLRNVLIYFDNDAKGQIVRRVLAQLKPDGVLYTGHAESLSSLGLPLKVVATAVHVHA
ncbi:MAG: protein-glutamate O-methyltransferase CheR [Burkholderiales bacterium]|nr:protein-glutamate O-methyltransferase CheR [Burkholderiales bacterium]MDE2161493.1 protein-glutamate O-methyltransferase CheR [Burkholderiales bacterium]MDE2503086.1 protein-glutamate O-methyltransferase CheR [Burkholderiales bacterium]